MHANRHGLATVRDGDSDAVLSSAAVEGLLVPCIGDDLRLPGHARRTRTEAHHEQWLSTAAPLQPDHELAAGGVRPERHQISIALADEHAAGV